MERGFFQRTFCSSGRHGITEALERYTREELAEPENRRETIDMLEIATNWRYDTLEKDTLTLPAELMERNQKLRFFFVAGYYDLQSTFDFVTYFLGRYCLPMERVTFKVYDSGHLPMSVEIWPAKSVRIYAVLSREANKRRG